MTPLIRALHIFLLVIALGSTSSRATAQDPRLRPGAAIRFGTDTSDALHVGQLARATADSLFLQRCVTCGRLTYSRIEINRLAVFHPAHRGLRFLSGFGYGGLAGLGLGVLAAKSCHGLGYECDGRVSSLSLCGCAGRLGGG